MVLLILVTVISGCGETPRPQPVTRTWQWGPLVPGPLHNTDGDATITAEVGKIYDTEDGKEVALDFLTLTVAWDINDLGQMNSTTVNREFRLTLKRGKDLSLHGMIVTSQEHQMNPDDSPDDQHVCASDRTILLRCTDNGDLFIIFNEQRTYAAPPRQGASIIQR